MHHIDHCFMSTRDLGMQILHQMLTPGDVDEEMNICHLALFVSLITTIEFSCSHFVARLSKYLDFSGIIPG